MPSNGQLRAQISGRFKNDYLANGNMQMYLI
jgi:hypothetical protein